MAPPSSLLLPRVLMDIRAVAGFALCIAMVTSKIILVLLGILGLSCYMKFGKK